MPDEAERDTGPPCPAWPDGFAATDEDRRALLVLSALRTITPRRLIALAARRGTAAAVLAQIRDGRAGSDGDRRFARSLDPETLAARAQACGARFVTWGSPEYPTQLEQIHDPPAALYVVGAGLPAVTSAVAIVGARRCTASGRELAADLGRALGLAGVTVVSGAARGIDAAAHEGVLSVGGSTLAVLGCGVDVAYDPGGRELLRRIGSDGTIVTEFAPGTRPEPRNFPARNRIVAGLCRATVAVEGAIGSGSLITAEHAMEFGREVYAVPGSVTNPVAHVPLQLIRDGAAMIRGSEDLLHDLGLGLDVEAVGEDLHEAQRRALETLAGPTLPEHVASTLGVGVPEAVTLLMELELRGFVRSIGGRYETTLKGARAPAR
ncbi:MAG TPA: DNA-processing protein DprA [Actinomycetota bacterium]|nr:DNA-processing protein DprA [Actinomycetota bacterium]